MDDDELADRIRTLGVFAQTLESNPRLTIRASNSAADTTDASTAVAAFAWRAPDTALELRDTLGEGGMGVVHLGVQRSLGRRVAVKALKKAHRTPATMQKLLAEAKVTGALEHPNVIPVHDIASDDDGSPLIVLKRIEGIGWGELMRDEHALLERFFGVEDVLEWHLGVLMQVCHAVHFAHSRGVLHRDLKPDNVMIGSFGEVYVLDWGLAVHIDAENTIDALELPLAKDMLQMAGTPSYMAPEMLGGNPSRLGRPTDVYLLGAILYEILTGFPPHKGRRLIEILHSVSQSQPSFPAGAPPELVAVATRAMARHPSDRFASADELRAALADFLRHRGSIELTEQAEARLSELESLTAQAEDAHRRALFAEARFGFAQALRSWPDNERAVSGQRRALLAMIEHELTLGDPRAASRFLNELADPPKELSERVRQALDAERADRDELVRLRRDLDPRIGHRARIAMTAALGIFWTLGPSVAELTGMGYARDAASLAAPPAIVLAIVLVVTYVLRRVVFASALNRLLIGAVVVSAVAEVSMHTGGALAGLTPAQTLAGTLLLFGVAIALVAIAVARTLVIAAIAYLAGFFLISLFPEQRAWIHSGVNLVFTTTLLYAWQTRARNSIVPAA